MPSETSTANTSPSRGGVDICARTWRADRSRTGDWSARGTNPLTTSRTDRWSADPNLREDPRTRYDVQDADESLAPWTRHRIGVRQRHRRRITGAPARFACPFWNPLRDVSGLPRPGPDLVVSSHKRIP